METLEVVALIMYIGAWLPEQKAGFGKIFVALLTLEIGIIFIPAATQGTDWFYKQRNKKPKQKASFGKIFLPLSSLCRPSHQLVCKQSNTLTASPGSCLMCRLGFTECKLVFSCAGPPVSWFGVTGITIEPERGRGLAGNWTDLGRILGTPLWDVMYAVVGIPPMETGMKKKKL